MFYTIKISYVVDQENGKSTLLSILQVYSYHALHLHIMISLHYRPTVCFIYHNNIHCGYIHITGLLEPNKYEYPIRTISTYWAEIPIFDQ